MPVARAAFFATRLSPAPVLRTVPFASLIAFVILDFLRLALFIINGITRMFDDVDLCQFGYRKVRYRANSDSCASQLINSSHRERFFLILVSSSLSNMQ